jgi:hypothetical protein
MSSSVDWFECPKCGGSASRDQDNRTGDIHFSCKCGWKGEVVEEDEKRPARYTKNIAGFVAQTFELVNGEYVCKTQEFIAGENEAIEDEYGEPINTDEFEEEEIAFPMNMEQPKDEYVSDRDPVLQLQKEDERKEFMKFRFAMHAIESLILGHAVAGIDITDPAYIQGIETAVDAMNNNI